ncbi:hypothetical protein [Catellatospora sichuanensis]|uniref:hypothetical protein n=1 Tax=Catellatospora sichuanensis TaxID=1969805 RepID=UPI0011827D76|nr:hypothetical protein [Catellatospora sichuanensis]
MGSGSADTLDQEPTGENEAGVEEVLADFVRKTDLIGVRFLRINGEVLEEDLRDVSNLNMRVVPTVRLRPGGTFDCRYDLTAQVLDSDNETLANLEVSLVASFVCDDADGTPTKTVELFIEQVGYFVVFPYVREALQSVTSRLALGSITLGLLQQGESSPMTATFTAGLGTLRSR